MTLRARLLAALVCCLALACDERAALDLDLGPGPADRAVDGAPAETLFTRLGGRPGVTAAVDGFLQRVLADDRINAYFLNARVLAGDGAANLGGCLVLQISAATGDPDSTYPGVLDNGYRCRGMASSHAGMGVSQSDFDDLVGHLVDELTERGVAATDIAAIGAALGATAPDIIEDPTDDGTLYQRFGRYPGILAAVDLFIGTVVVDDRINHFFAEVAGDRLERLRHCLARQLSAIDGPAQYGGEVAGLQPGILAEADPCGDMDAVHAEMRISIDDFDALIEDLVIALDGAGVADADIAALAGILIPLCGSMVVPPEACTADPR